MTITCVEEPNEIQHFSVNGDWWHSTTCVESVQCIRLSDTKKEKASMN